ncbi:AsmA-like C-terminal region-containing protein [Flavitalea sp. BT771]|uniref:AsmA family protein n=1 Tax=Flavitalea sp. BT771 TaxID=3063329 RepID=UPI0026E1EC8A|nr:AsmA-like C-terminal region-containing protein [Flavitalea sp. BT771]MDO6431595.1 AsmA-like C-terminal region-containing protein [Flavitalea sp. BT771]MDV6220503.1 AsmA-like C-terminal region-containing protein [Flavitalea sp. BT771]
MLKKTLKITGIILLVLVATAVAIPFFFKGKITRLIKEQINKNIAAKVDFSDVDLSLFRNFPRLSVALDSLRVTGIDEFSEDTLVSAQRINVALDLFSVFGSEMKIHSIRVDHPRVHAIVHKNGHANWNITLPDTAAAATASGASKPFKMALQQYAVTDGYVSYKDDSSHMSCEISGLNHSGKGDFTSDEFVLQTSTQTAALSFNYGGIPYLIRTRANVGADFQIDNKINKYTFKVDDLTINDLKLHTEGFFQLVNDSTYDMDIRFNGPSLDFKSILSLVPAMYSKDFAGIKTSGQASLAGSVKGRYDSKHIPAYHVDLEVKNGFFQYPDLPKPVKNINLVVKTDNPDGVTDHTVVEIPQGHIEMEETPFDFRMLLKTPVSDPYIDAAAKGRLDLAKVAQFVKLEAGTRLAGVLNADMHVRGNLSAVQKQQYEKFDAGGTLGLTGFSYASTPYPTPISIEDLLLTFNPKNVTLNELKGGYGKTHFEAGGVLNNLLAYMLQHQPLDGSLNVKADLVDLDQLMGTTGAGGSTAVKTDTAAAHTGATGEAFAVPANINFTLHAGVDQIHYGNLDLRQVSGNLRIADETVKLENVRAEGLDGLMVLNGAYSTKISKKTPVFAMSYDLQKLDVQKTFYAFNSVQKLMPAGKYIAGKFSSRLTMDGVLGSDMKPDLKTLNGNGTVLLVDGALKDFAPTDKLAQALHLDQLKDIPVKDIKTAFSFKNGRVIVDPFHVKVKDIDMEVGGSHGFDQTLDYDVAMKLPRSLLGGQANNVVNDLVAKAGSKGVNVKMNDQVALPVKVGGTMTSPVLKMDLKSALAGTADGLKQQATDLVKARVDSAKQQLKDTAQAVGKQALKDAGTALKNQLLGNKDTTGKKSETLDDTKKKAQDAGKGLLNGLFNKKKAG